MEGDNNPPSVSLSAAQKLMLNEGFSYSSHKKDTFYDGHERPDVVDDCQTRFLPQLKEFESQLVRYDLQDTDKEILPPDTNGLFVKPCLVLCTHVR